MPRKFDTENKRIHKEMWARVGLRKNGKIPFFFPIKAKKKKRIVNKTRASHLTICFKKMSKISCPNIIIPCQTVSFYPRLTGEVGKEMYIVNRGRLHVVADNGKTVLATLKPGKYLPGFFFIQCRISPY